MKVRARQLKGAHDALASTYFVNRYNAAGVVDYHVAYRTVVQLPGAQYTESEGHPWPRSRKGKRRRNMGDVGGPFYTERRYVLAPPVISFGVREYRNNTGKRVVETGSGYIPLALPLSSFLTLSPPDPDPMFAGQDRFYSLKSSSYPSLPEPGDQDALGTTAIARCKPTNSPADLSVAIGELSRDGLPSAMGSVSWKSDLSAAKKAASEHLNYQFGILPVVSDIKKTASTFKNMDDLVAQFERDAGRVVRRRYNFPVEESVVNVVVPGTPAGASAYPGGQGIIPTGPNPRIELELVTRTQSWFSGAFTYTLPKGMNSRSVLGQIRAKADRLGLDPDLDTLWNVAPWTWAVDWFSNAGDYVSNVNDIAKYGLVLKYGYVMTHTRVTATYTAPDYSITMDRKGVGAGSVPPTTLVAERKMRTPATPFGFGVSADSLSGMQLSILAALGISRR